MGIPTGQKEPYEKAIPWKVELGTTAQAVSILQKILTQLGGNLDEPDNGQDPPF